MLSSIFDREVDSVNSVALSSVRIVDGKSERGLFQQLNVEVVNWMDTVVKDVKVGNIVNSGCLDGDKAHFDVIEGSMGSVLHDVEIGNVVMSWCLDSVQARFNVAEGSIGSVLHDVEVGNMVNSGCLGSDKGTL